MWLTQRTTDPQDHVPVTLTPISSHPEHSETLNHFGGNKVGEFDDWWIVFFQKHVLQNHVSVR